MKRFSEYKFGDILVTWWLDEQNHMGMTLIPAGMQDQVREQQHHPDDKLREDVRQNMP